MCHFYIPTGYFFEHQSLFQNKCVRWKVNEALLYSKQSESSYQNIDEYFCFISQ